MGIFSRKSDGYFEGFYYKHAFAEDTVSFIPSISHSPGGGRQAALQVITGEGSHSFSYPTGHIYRKRGMPSVEMGACRFTSLGCTIDLRKEGLDIAGEIGYGQMSRLKGDIMGPFRFAPFMECRHTVVSMGHELRGRLSVNGRDMSFSGAWGYREGDSGHSFPKEYLWTQGAEEGLSVMMSCADIPYLGRSFPGVICALLYNGKEYVLATYNGLRILERTPTKLTVKQKGIRLSAEYLGSGGHSLNAPVKGVMRRRIKENLRCPVRYRMMEGGRTVFDTVLERASFEYSRYSAGEE